MPAARLPPRRNASALRPAASGASARPLPLMVDPRHPISRSLGLRAPLLWLVGPFMIGLIAGRAVELGPASLQLGVALVASAIAMFASWHAPRWGPPIVALAMLI